MAGRRKKDEADVENFTIGGTGRGRRVEGVGELVDAHAALPGAIKQVRNQRLAPETNNTRELRRQYAHYLRELEDFSDDGAKLDPVVAISKVFGISLAEAEARQHELHDKMTSASKGLSVQELMRRYDLGAEARIRMLARHARSPDARISIVAIKEANDLDESLKGGGGNSFEEWIAALL